MAKRKGLVSRRIPTSPSRKLAVACPFCGKKLGYRTQGLPPKKTEGPWFWIFEYAELRRCPRCNLLYFVDKGLKGTEKWRSKVWVVLILRDKGWTARRRWPTEESGP